MNWKMIEFPTYKTSKVTIGDLPVRLVVGKTEVDIVPHAIGVDPGVNFGIADLFYDSALVFHGKLPKREHSSDHGIDAYNLMKEFLATAPLGLVVVEGAAYAKTMGQVMLAEIRYGFYHAAIDSGCDAVILPPLSARKIAFGSGRINAFDEWPLLNHNGADALGLAIAATHLMEEKNGIPKD